MSYVFLDVKEFHSKDKKDFYVLYVLDVKNLVVQNVFISNEQFGLLGDFNMFDDISSLIDFRYNQKEKCYQLALR